MPTAGDGPPQGGAKRLDRTGPRSRGWFSLQIDRADLLRWDRLHVDHIERQFHRLVGSRLKQLRREGVLALGTANEATDMVLVQHERVLAAGAAGLDEHG